MSFAKHFNSNSNVDVPAQKGSNRSIYLDIVKGFTIFLVVYGHCIEYYSVEYLKENAFYSDVVHKIIYSFHMPLFMLISGYLFYGSITHHPWKYNLKTRFTKLLLPVFSWNTLLLIIQNSIFLIEDKVIPWKNELLSYCTVLWFLWAIFWCSIIILFVSRWFYDNIFVYIGLLAIMLFIPGIYGINLYVYMYPFFVMGYLWNKHGIVDKLKDKKISPYIKIMVFFFLFILFVALCKQYTTDDYIYISGSGILKGLKTHSPFIDYHQISINFYRYLIGFVGSAISLIAIRYTFNKYEKISREILIKLGQKSLGIYIISVMLLNDFILPYLSFDKGINYGVVGVEAVTILIVTYSLTTFIERSPLLRKFFLGGR